TGGLLCCSEDEGQPIRPSSLTASRSSPSSATDASILPRENSLMSRPWTISQLPSLVVTGKDEIRPSGTSYEPSETTAIDSQSPSAEPFSQSRVWSIVAAAAEAAEDA